MWTLVVAGGTAACQIGGRLERLEIFSHFTFQVGLVALGLGIVAGLKREWVALALLAACLSANGLVAAQAYATGTTRADSVGRFVVMTHNVHSGNGETVGVLEYVRRVKPDVVIALEVTRAWLTALEELRPEFEVVVAEAREDNFGLAVVSRHKVASAKIVHPGEAGIGFAEVQVDVGETRWSILGIHPVPPLGIMWTEERDQGLEYAARWASQQLGPAVVAGDFNTTPYAPSFRRLLDEGGLRDSRQGIGLQPTWPVASWIPSVLRIPIDHVLHNDRASTLSREVGPASGSDHAPVVATLAAVPE